MTAPVRSFVLPLLVAVFTGGISAAQDVGSKVYLDGMKSCVLVLNLQRGGQGSGSVIDLKDGYVLTNWHVVREATDMLIIFPLWEKGRPVVESDSYMAQARKLGVLGKVVASDQKVDLAVIKLSDPAKIPKGTEAVKFAPESPLAGNKIYSIGNPAASEALWIYTPGDVRQVYKKTWKSGSMGRVLGEHEARIIEATSLTNSGDSGGPCFNDKCEQVGVTQGGLRSAVAQGFSYFIDVTEVRGFLKAKKIAYSGADDVVEAVEPKTEPKQTATVDTPKKELATPMVDAAAEEMARQEKSAASMLSLIRPLAKDPNKQSFAVDKLKQLVKLYPKTEAAKEAQTLLKQLQ